MTDSTSTPAAGADGAPADDALARARERVRRAGGPSLEALAQAFADAPDCVEVSGGVQRTYEFKVRAVFPVNRHTEQLLAARTGSHEQRVFLRELAELLKVTSSLGLHVTEATLNVDAARLFRGMGGEGVCALLPVRLTYGAHRAYTARELHPSLKAAFGHPRYPDEELALAVLKNG